MELKSKSDQELRQSFLRAFRSIKNYYPEYELVHFNFKINPNRTNYIFTVGLKKPAGLFSFMSVNSRGKPKQYVLHLPDHYWTFRINCNLIKGSLNPYFESSLIFVNSKGKVLKKIFPNITESNTICLGWFSDSMYQPINSYVGFWRQVFQVPSLYWGTQFNWDYEDDDIEISKYLHGILPKSRQSKYKYYEIRTPTFLNNINKRKIDWNDKAFVDRWQHSDAFGVIKLNE